jgi:hypothetical protein
MRLTRAVALLVPIVLCAPVAGAVGTTASAATATQISITGTPRTAVYHDEAGPKTPDVVQHKGKLTTADGTPVAGAEVHLERKLTGEDWVTLEYAEPQTTNAKGVYRLASYVAGNARYRVSYAGDSIYAPAVSGLAKLRAMRDFNAVLVEKERSAVLKGNINPGWDNKIVTWERKTCKTCSWKAIDKERSGDSGRWSFSAAYPPLGKKWNYRATIPGTKDFVRSVSAGLSTTTTAARVAAR